MARKTSQLNRRPPLLSSRFDMFDEANLDPLLKDFSTDLQQVVDIIVEIVETPGGQTGILFDADFVVSLSNNKTFGKYLHGQTVPALGKTAREVLLDIAIEYLLPDVTSLTSASLIKTFEVGEAFPAGAVSVAYVVSNPINIKTQPPNVGVLTTNIAGATFPVSPILLVASGSFNIDIAADTRFAVPGTRTITLQGTNSNDQTFDGTGTITGLYKQFYGPVATAASDSAGVRALPASRFTNAANVFNLNTGATHKTFQLWLPSGQSLTLVLDLDALSANITSQYVSSALSVNDANGVSIAGTLYTMIQAVPYTVDHRHQLTLS